jgi:hypothetical protein
MSRTTKREIAQHRKKIFVYGDPKGIGDVQIYKKRSVREKRDDYKKLKASQYGKAYYSHEERKMKWGLFNTRGYRPLCLFATKEEAQECLDSKGKYARLYDIRELDWGEEE